MAFPKGSRRHHLPDIEGIPWDDYKFKMLHYYNLGLFPKKEMARMIGVSDRTLRRWLDGTDIPDPKYKGLLIQTYFEGERRHKRYLEGKAL